jgi:hypothetical protein
LHPGVDRRDREQIGLPPFALSTLTSTVVMPVFLGICIDVYDEEVGELCRGGRVPVG